MSRFLNKGKNGASASSNAGVPGGTNSLEDDAYTTGEDLDTRYGTGRSRYLAMKERRNRLARSRSSHQLLGNDDEDMTPDEPVSPTTVTPSAYLASRCDVYYPYRVVTLPQLPFTLFSTEAC